MIKQVDIILILPKGRKINVYCMAEATFLYLGRND